MPELNFVATSATDDPAGAHGQVTQPYYTTVAPGYNYASQDNPSGGGYMEYGSGTQGSLPFRVDQDGNVTAANLVPTAQVFALANNTYKNLLNWTVTGQTDVTSAFGLIAGSQTYGSSPAVQGPAAWFGYNPALLSASISNSPNGAVGMSIFGDAGDSNNGAGKHGLEMNPACFRTPDGTKSTNAMEMVAFNDNTNTVNTIFRCGTGNSNGTYSGITLQNADASITYLAMGPVYSDGIRISRPVTLMFDTSALGNAIAIKNSNNAAGSATFTLDCNNSAGINALAYAVGGVQHWIAGHAVSLANWYYVEDVVNTRFPFRIAPGASALASHTTVDTQLTVTSSLIVSSGGALAATATDGFLYIPVLTGAPTGVPTSNAGSVPICFYNDKIYIYDGTSWKGAVIS